MESLKLSRYCIRRELGISWEPSDYFGRERFTDQTYTIREEITRQIKRIAFFVPEIETSTFYEVIKIVEASNWWTSYVFVEFTCDNNTPRHARGCKSGRALKWLFWIQNCFVLWVSSLRNEMYLDYKLRMDQALINIWGKRNKQYKIRLYSTESGMRLTVKRNGNK